VIARSGQARKDADSFSRPLVTSTGIASAESDIQHNADAVLRRPSANPSRAICLERVMRRLLLSLCGFILGTGILTARPVQAQQSLDFYLGGFTPRGDQTFATDGSSVISGRDTNDVLAANANVGGFDFSLKDLKGVTGGFDWIVGLNEHFDASLGLGFHSKTAPSRYVYYYNPDTGGDITQDFKLRVVPFTATIRFLPIGRHDAIIPYIGGGVGVNFWRYEEAGQFIEFSESDLPVFSNAYPVSGASAGPVALLGVTVPIGAFGVGFEARYSRAVGSLPDDQGFYGTKIDLGGMNYLFTMHLRF
jgi:hypothetical protein